MLLLYFGMHMVRHPMIYTNISYRRMNGKTFAITGIGKEARFKEINRTSHKEHWYIYIKYIYIWIIRHDRYVVMMQKRMRCNCHCCKTLAIYYRKFQKVFTSQRQNTILSSLRHFVRFVVSSVAKNMNKRQLLIIFLQSLQCHVTEQASMMCRVKMINHLLASDKKHIKFIYISRFNIEHL